MRRMSRGRRGQVLIVHGAGEPFRYGSKHDRWNLRTPDLTPLFAHRRGMSSEAHGPTPISERWTSSRYRVEGPHGSYRYLEEFRAWTVPGWAAQSGWGRPRVIWLDMAANTARSLRLSDRILFLLAGATEAVRFCSRPVRGRNFTIEGLPDDAVLPLATVTGLASAFVRSHATARGPAIGLVSGWMSRGWRRAADVERAAWVLLSRAGAGRGGGRGRDRQGGVRLRSE